MKLRAFTFIRALLAAVLIFEATVPGVAAPSQPQSALAVETIAAALADVREAGYVTDAALEKIGHSPVVFLILDVHQHPEAQKNISQVLRGIQRGLNAGGRGDDWFVGAEAAYGRFDFQSYRSFDDVLALRDAADYLLDQNQLSAVSHFGLTVQPREPLILGVDDPALYEKNIQAFRAAAQTPASPENPLLKKMVSFEITPQEWNEIQSLSLPDNLLPWAIFYRTAVERDRAIITNLSTRFADHAAAALVVGGFHSPGIKKALREQGYSYIEITPKFSYFGGQDGRGGLDDFLETFSTDRLSLGHSDMHVGAPRPRESSAERALSYLLSGFVARRGWLKRGDALAIGGRLARRSVQRARQGSVELREGGRRITVQVAQKIKAAVSFDRVPGLGHVVVKYGPALPRWAMISFFVIQLIREGYFGAASLVFVAAMAIEASPVGEENQSSSQRRAGNILDFLGRNKGIRTVAFNFGFDYENNDKAFLREALRKARSNGQLISQSVNVIIFEFKNQRDVSEILEQCFLAAENYYIRERRLGIEQQLEGDGYVIFFYDEHQPSSVVRGIKAARARRAAAASQPPENKKIEIDPVQKKAQDLFAKWEQKAAEGQPVLRLSLLVVENEAPPGFGYPPNLIKVFPKTTRIKTTPKVLWLHFDENQQESLLGLYEWAAQQPANYNLALQASFAVTASLADAVGGNRVDHKKLNALPKELPVPAPAAPVVAPPVQETAFSPVEPPPVVAEPVQAIAVEEPEPKPVVKTNPIREIVRKIVAEPFEEGPREQISPREFLFRIANLSKTTIRLMFQTRKEAALMHEKLKKSFPKGFQFVCKGRKIDIYHSNQDVSNWNVLQFLLAYIPPDKLARNIHVKESHARWGEHSMDFYFDPINWEALPFPVDDADLKVPAPRIILANRFKGRRSTPPPSKWIIRSPAADIGEPAARSNLLKELPQSNSVEIVLYFRSRENRSKVRRLVNKTSLPVAITESKSRSPGFIAMRIVLDPASTIDHSKLYKILLRLIPKGGFKQGVVWKALRRPVPTEIHHRLVIRYDETIRFPEPASANLSALPARPLYDSEVLVESVMKAVPGMQKVRLEFLFGPATRERQHTLFTALADLVTVQLPKGTVLAGAHADHAQFISWPIASASLASLHELLQRIFAVAVRSEADLKVDGQPAKNRVLATIDFRNALLGLLLLGKMFFEPTGSRYQAASMDFDFGWPTTVVLVGMAAAGWLIAKFWPQLALRRLQQFEWMRHDNRELIERYAAMARDHAAVSILLSTPHAPKGPERAERLIAAGLEGAIIDNAVRRVVVSQIPELRILLDRFKRAKKDLGEAVLKRRQTINFRTNSVVHYSLLDLLDLIELSGSDPGAKRELEKVLVNLRNLERKRLAGIIVTTHGQVDYLVQLGAALERAGFPVARTTLAALNPDFSEQANPYYVYNALRSSELKGRAIQAVAFKSPDWRKRWAFDDLSQTVRMTRTDWKNVMINLVDVINGDSLLLSETLQTSHQRALRALLHA